MTDDLAPGRAAIEAGAVLSGACYWLTGLPGSGKTTLAEAFLQRLRSAGHDACLLDADVVRQGLNRDLGYGPHDRSENVRRLSEVARLFALEGFTVLVSSIAPYQADRELARARFPEGRYFEVFVDAPIEVCIARDPKGLYRKARRGEAAQVTGVSAPYERPRHPDIALLTAEASVESCVEVLLRHHGDVVAPRLAAGHGKPRDPNAHIPWRR